MTLDISPATIDAARAAISDPEYFGLPEVFRHDAWAILHAARRQARAPVHGPRPGGPWSRGPQPAGGPEDAA